MATLAQSPQAVLARDERFFMIGAVVMTLVLVAGFSLQLAMGRSSFSEPWPVHLHAFLFFGWTALYLTQNALVATGNVAVHRRLGWLALGWIPAMIAAGIWLTIRMAQRGATPFFFEPGYFLVMNPVSVLTFAGLAGAAIINRRRTAWHRRLMFCAMSMLLGPGFGRLLPNPLFIPWAAWVIFGALILFPLAGAANDFRRRGRVHPAWLWGIGTMLLAHLSVGVIAHSPVGLAFYRSVTAGTPGAALAPLAYPPPPVG